MKTDSNLMHSMLMKMVVGFLLLLLLKFLFCVDFLFLKIWFAFIAMHLRWNTFLLTLPCFVLSSFQVNDFQQELGICY